MRIFDLVAPPVVARHGFAGRDARGVGCARRVSVATGRVDARKGGGVAAAADGYGLALELRGMKGDGEGERGAEGAKAECGQV